MIFYLLSGGEVREIFHRLGYPFDLTKMTSRQRGTTWRGTSTAQRSWVAHSWVLARLDRRRSWELFLQALNSDIADLQGGTTHEGIHLGAMAGTVDLIQRLLRQSRLAVTSSGSTRAARRGSRAGS